MTPEAAQALGLTWQEELEQTWAVQPEDGLPMLLHFLSPGPVAFSSCLVRLSIYTKS